MLFHKFHFALVLMMASLFPHALFAAEPDWSIYSDMLHQYVKPETHHDVTLNWVNYTGLKTDPRWEQVVQAVENFSPERLNNREEKLAFYINAYNIFSLKKVIDNWPVESIKDVGNFFRPVWKRDAGSIGGERVSLDHLEHEILRPMGEPRIHFAIVCASISCPDLLREPYRAAQLDLQLKEQVRGFLDNEKKGLSLEGSKLKVSKIFSWFKEDFSGGNGVVPFLQKYKKLPQSLSLKADLPYDWRVNGN